MVSSAQSVTVRELQNLPSLPYRLPSSEQQILSPCASPQTPKIRKQSGRRGKWRRHQTRLKSGTIIINFISAKAARCRSRAGGPEATATEPLNSQSRPRTALTMTVVFWVGSDVLEDQRACRRDDEDLQHEIVESLKENLAEALCLHWLSVVVTKEGRPLRKRISSNARVHFDFKLVTDAIDTCRNERQAQLSESGESARTYRLGSPAQQFLRRTFCSCTLSPIQSVPFSLGTHTGMSATRVTYRSGRRPMP